MKLLFLGVSDALSIGEKEYQSNMLLESESGRKMLIDCGTDIRHSLHEQKYSYSDIDSIYISHLHSDHIGGLEWLGFAKYFIDKKKPLLYLNSQLGKLLWSKVLSGGMSSLENEAATLETFFETIKIKQNQFNWEDIGFKMIQTEHTFNNSKLVPSYGLIISNAAKKIFITTDTRFTPDYFAPIYQDVDIIFHDCETSKRTSGQHARYEELKTLDASIKNKMWLYDYNAQHIPNAVKDGFKGFVTRGQSFVF